MDEVVTGLLPPGATPQIHVTGTTGASFTTAGRRLMVLPLMSL